MPSWVDATGLTDRLQDLLHVPGVAPAAFILAFLAGASHALAPGHGKTLAAAYLVGSRGRWLDAAWLGGSVAIMHTVSVLVIAVAWTFFSLSDLVQMQTLTSVLQILAGLIAIGMGLWLLRRWRRGESAHVHGPGGHTHVHPHTHAHVHEDAPAEEVLVPADGPDPVAHEHAHEDGHDHSHPHDHDHPHPHDHDHDHVHPHDHPHPHTHSHEPSTTRPGLALLGVSGGLIPSPGAFLVLVTGLFLGRGGFALLLVLTFGIGMAVVLFGIGLLAVGGNTIVLRTAGKQSGVLSAVMSLAPVLTALAITALGMAITAVGVGALTA